MGCCGSKQSDYDEDERVPILRANELYPENRIIHGSIEQNQAREFDSLQRIVERTAGNLIDIPSTLQLERLQQQEAQHRSNEYIAALNAVKLPEQTIKKLYNMTSVVKAGGDLPNEQLDGVLKSSASSAVNSIKAPSVREVLAEKAIDSKTLGWMTNAMGELHRATEQIDVKDVGDLIVTLSPPKVA